MVQRYAGNGRFRKFFFPSEEQQILRDLDSEKLQVCIGWVLIVIWLASVWALIALVVFFMAGCFPGKPKQQAPAYDESAKNRVMPKYSLE